MARIGLNITVTGLTGFLIIRWVKASAPAAEVGRSAAFPFDYDDIYNITGLDPVVYIVQLWRSDDGTSLSQLIKDWSIDASIYNETTISTYQYLVGRGWDNTTPVVTEGVWADPADIDTQLSDTRLDGATQDELLVHEAGYGNKTNAEYTLLAGGGIVLTDGKTFDQDVAWFITRTQTVAQQVSSPGGTSMFDGVSTLTANRDVYVSASDNLYNKLVIANWAGTVGIITFPDLTLIPDGTHITFNTHGGSQKYLKLQFDAGDTVRFLNQLVNIIYLAKCEKISLYFFAGICYVIDYDGRALQRGQVITDYDNSRNADTLACVLADEATGELLEADYPGLYAFVAALPSGFVVLGTGVGQWSYDSGGGVYPNKRYYGIRTTGSLAVRVPHLSGMVAKFGATPGLYEADAVGPMSLEIREGSGGSSTGPIENKGFSGQDNAAGWITNGITGAEKYIRATGTETRVKSFGQIPFIIL